MSNTIKQSIKEDIVDFLKANKGKKFVSRDLSAKFGLYGSEIRALVNEARTEGITICSGGFGYYYSEDPVDIASTINNLKSRARHMNRAVTGMTGQTFMREVI